MGKCIKLDNDVNWDASGIVIKNPTSTARHYLSDRYPLLYKWTHAQTEVLELPGLSSFLVTFNKIGGNNNTAAFMAVVCTPASPSNTGNWYTLLGGVSNMGSMSLSGCTLTITVGASIWGGLSVLRL